MRFSAILTFLFASLAVAAPVDVVAREAEAAPAPEAEPGYRFVILGGQSNKLIYSAAIMDHIQLQSMIHLTLPEID
jgi:hypothetical protein